MVGGVAFFGDRRVDRVHRFLHDRLVRQGPRGISVRRLGGSRAGEVRIGRFLRNGKVTVEKIVERAASGTALRVAGLDVLAIQDTTSFRDDGLGNSLVGHATIAVEAEQGALLGLVDARVIERHGGGGKGAKGRALCDKESQRWLDGLQASGRLVQAGAVRVTALADREGDIYEMFADRPEGVEVLVRAAQDRAVSEGAGRLFSSLADRPEREHSIDLPARPGQKKRKARIAVRFGAVTLRRPKNRPVAPGMAAQQSVFLVEAREVDPPPKVTPAHWRLLTSHRVESFEQARWITQLYRRRWVIEQLFRTIKTKGFDIERVSMETAPFRTLCAMTLEAGISCMQMVQSLPPRRRGTATAAPDGRSRTSSKTRTAPRSKPSPPRLKERPKSRKIPIQKDRWPSPHGSAHASEDGPDTMENPDPSSCSMASTSSEQYNADTASSTMCESGRATGGG